MIKTHGLTHISLAVRDPERSLRFYQEPVRVMSVASAARPKREREHRKNRAEA